jgi:hypothetical protein
MPSAPSRFVASKTPVPSDLRTKEWDIADAWTRERAFFMAGVTDARILAAHQSAAARIAAGTLSEGEARKELSTLLDRIGYRPAPGQEGTIKDLRSLRRHAVAIDTNVAMARNWAARQRALKRLAAFPAQRLVRLRDRREKRRWPQGLGTGAPGADLWADALRRTGVFAGASADQPVALVTHPVWTALSRFGNPYPPFDFMSGIGVEPVGRDEAKALGLLEGGAASEMLRPRPMESPNASTAADMSAVPRQLRDALAGRLQGLAEFDGDTLRMTDPNGTRPYTAEKLAEVWSRPLPERFHDLPGEGHMQREALRQWASDHEGFKEANGTDRWEDLQRLHMRLPDPAAPVDLWRGMRMADAKLDEFLRRIDGKRYRARAEYPLESWTDSPAAARRYAATGGRGWSVVVRVRGARRAKDFSALVRALRETIAKKGPPPVETESEWTYRTGESFKVRSVRKDGETRTVEIELEEAHQ